MRSAGMLRNIRSGKRLPLLRRFLANRCGNFAIMTGLMALPMVVAMGGAVDYSNALRIRSEVQAAADAAALAAAKYVGTDTAERERQADKFFEANISPDVTVTDARLTVANNRFTYDVDFDVAMYFLPLIQMPTLAMEVQAVSADAGEPLDIVLVLDSSGSMDQQNRMVELKEAVATFLGNFDQNAGKVQVALVPFDHQVRVDNEGMPTGNFSEQANPYSADTDCAKVKDKKDKKKCEREKKKKEDKASQEISEKQIMECSSFFNYYHQKICEDAVSRYGNLFIEGKKFEFNHDDTKYEFETKKKDDQLITTAKGSGKENFQKITVASQPYKAPVGEPDSEGGTPTSGLLIEDTETWSGCLIDRSQPYDVRSDPVSTDAATQYPKASCTEDTLLAVHPLTTNLTMLNNAVQSMEPSGNTNITIGIQWGMEAFTRNAPLTGAQVDDAASKVMIILTDGENTENRWWLKGDDSADDDDAPDKRAALACAHAKASPSTGEEEDEEEDDDEDEDAGGMGIEIYTIRLAEGNAELLEDCATDSEHYFAIEDASDLEITFQAIADRVKRVKIVS